MEIIYGNANNSPTGSFNFNKLDSEFKKVIAICSKCKFLDDDSDFPNSFCDKSCEMIDYHFCSPKCPLGKFIVLDKNGVGKKFV